MKKALALFLALVMVFGLVACAAKPAAEKEAEPVKEEVTPAKEESAPAAEEEKPAEEEIPAWKQEHPTWLCEEKQTLSVYTWEGVSSSYPAPSNDLGFWQYMEDYTNVHIEWEAVPYADFGTLVSAKLASGGSLNDIVMVGNTFQTALDAGVNGMFIDLAENWDEYFPLTQAYMDAAGVSYKKNLSNEDGTMYALAGLKSPVENRIGLLYNTFWMDAIGCEEPTTIEEFTEVLRKMKAAGDLNGNGLDDEIYLTATEVNWLLPSLTNAFGIEAIEGYPLFAADESGNVYPEYTSDNMKAFLSWLNMLYQEGLLDPEITTNTMDIVAEKVTADRVGVVSMYSSFAGTYGGLTSQGQEDNNREIYYFGMPLASEWAEKPVMTMYEAYDMFTGISSSCADPKLAANWLDVLYADPHILNVRACGPIDVNWVYNDQGEVEFLSTDEGKTPTNIRDWGAGQIALPHIQTSLQILGRKSMTQPWFTDRYAKLRDNYEWKMPSVPQAPGMTEDENELKDTYYADLSAGWEEYRDKFITGELDTEKDWDSYVKTMEALGLEEMRECYQMVYDRINKN